MKMGMVPPLSGWDHNAFKDSNGAFIRTEIWACLAPGCPDVACKYVYEDACVDHGAQSEGTIAAVFVAAVERAAFVEKDLRKLVEIGFSRIPADSRVAQSVRTVIECYDKGMDYKSARDLVLAQNADIGDGWFQAPSNIAYVVIGLLWGEGDFKKSMLYAINCGDDTDCTGGTLGAIFLPLYDITDFLYFIGSVFAPMIAIQIADFFILKQNKEASAFSIKNLIIWLVGFVLYRMLMNVDIIIGNTLPDMIITIMICVAFSKLGNLKEKRG